MSFTEKRKWKIFIYTNNFTFYMPSPRKIALDLGLMVTGAATCYGLGLLAGELIDHVPYINQWLPQAVEYISGIKVMGNLDGLVGLLGGIYGLTNSGTKTFEDNPDKLEKITSAPITLRLKE